MAYGAIAAAIIGAGASAYGASKNKIDATGGYEQAHAGIQVNNPDYNTPFGNTRLRKDPGPTDKRHDDTFSIDVNLSPEMQALASQLQSIAGSGRGSYSSGGTPQGFQDRFNQALGYSPAIASYERPERGFGFGDGPAEVGSGYQDGVHGMTDREALEWARSNTNLSGPAYSYMDNLLDERNQPDADFYVSGSFNPRFSNLAEGNQGYLNEFLAAIAPHVGDQPNLPFTPNLEGMTNQEAYDWMVSHTGWEPSHSAGRNNKGFSSWLKNNPEIGGQRAWGYGNVTDLEGMKGGEKFGPAVDQLLQAIRDVSTPVPGQAGYVGTLPGESTGPIWESNEPDPRTYDPNAYNGLVSSLAGAMQ